jgi:hypothetical protein
LQQRFQFPINRREQPNDDQPLLVLDGSLVPESLGRDSRNSHLRGFVWSVIVHRKLDLPRGLSFTGGGCDGSFVLAR